MILGALYRLHSRLEADPDYDIAPPGRSYQKVTFVVVLERDGSLVDLQDARRSVKGRMLPRRVLVLGKTKPSGSGLNPCFLWDAPGYLLGFDPDRPERAARSFEAFRDKHVCVEGEIEVPEFSAVCRFLQGWEPSRCDDHPILDELGGGFGVFQIRGETRFVHEHPVVVEWWEHQATSSEEVATGQCLVTGEFGPLARLHEPKIKGVQDAQPSGATIAGFNDPAYWSYGLKQGFNAPVSVEAARRYTMALNALLDGPRRDKHRMLLGGTTVAFWTERPTPTEDIFLAFAAEGSAVIETKAAQDGTLRAKLEAFLAALRRGAEAYDDLEQSPRRTVYFILGLAAPTKARVAVRFFHQGTVAELIENLRHHHLAIGIERQFGEGSARPEPEFPPLRLLLDQTCPRNNGKPARDKIPPLLAGTLFESVVTGARYPEGLYAAIMRRIAADRTVNYPRACAIKGYLVRNQGKEISVSLDPSRTEPAYRLGRVFAALEKTQLEAHSDEHGRPLINKTIRDSFYSSASATPLSVFPRLFRTYQHHLAKLEGGRKVNREKLVQELLAPLADIPAHFGLVDQGLFALGYYHQMNAFFTKKDNQSGAVDA